jgi:hypothetical protein
MKVFSSGEGSRGRRRTGLYLCEAEIALRLGISDERWRKVRSQLERQGLPKIDPLFNGRCWGAVEAWCIERYRSAGAVVARADGQEKWG